MAQGVGQEHGGRPDGGPVRQLDWSVAGAGQLAVNQRGDIGDLEDFQGFAANGYGFEADVVAAFGRVEEFVEGCGKGDDCVHKHSHCGMDCRQ